MKSKVNKLSVDKLVPVPVDLSKLSKVVKNDVVKKYVYKTRIKNIEDKILDITNLALNTTLDAKINRIKNEIPSINNLATTTALTAVENKIPNVSNLAKNTDYNTKINEIENKITTDHDHDKYIATILAQANLTSKNDIANFTKKTHFDDKLKNLNKCITSN